MRVTAAMSLHFNFERTSSAWSLGLALSKPKKVQFFSFFLWFLEEVSGFFTNPMRAHPL